MLFRSPDLYGAVLCRVPLLDMLRYQNFLLAKYWVPEYGSSESAEQFKWLRAYSPYHNLKAGTRYPAVLFTASGKRLLGCLLGSVNSRREVPRLLDLWRRGLLDLESMITMRGDLADIDRAFNDLAAGRGIRTVLAI